MTFHLMSPRTNDKAPLRILSVKKTPDGGSLLEMEMRWPDDYTVSTRMKIDRAQAAMLAEELVGPSSTAESPPPIAPVDPRRFGRHPVFRAIADVERAFAVDNDQAGARAHLILSALVKAGFLREAEST